MPFKRPANISPRQPFRARGAAKGAGVRLFDRFDLQAQLAVGYLDFDGLAWMFANQRFPDWRHVRYATGQRIGLDRAHDGVRGLLAGLIDYCHAVARRDGLRDLAL